MSDQKPEAAGASLLFLREEQIRQAQDMLFLAWRDFAAAADPLLARHGLGRAHHRALHFIGRSPGLTVTDLLAVLCITKQSLARVLATLVAKGLVTQIAGREDRRQRRLHLTETGTALERSLFDCQRERLLAAYREAGGPAVEGFRRVLRGIMTRAARHTLDAQDTAPHNGRP
jgi:DNA-binding MarR family transcriptional regulator